MRSRRTEFHTIHSDAENVDTKHSRLCGRCTSAAQRITMKFNSKYRASVNQPKRQVILLYCPPGGNGRHFYRNRPKRARERISVSASSDTMKAHTGQRKENGMQVVETALPVKKRGARATAGKKAVQPVQLPSADEAPLQSLSRREKDDDYGGLVAVLNPQWRVICGSCGLQWVVQRRRTARLWENVAFCATKQGLLLRLPKWNVDAKAMAVIRALPERFPRVPDHGARN